MNEISKLEYALELLPDSLKGALMCVSQSEREKITELRLRRGKFFSAVLFSKEYFITYDGRLMNSSLNAVRVGDEEIDFTFKRAFQGSVHSFARELSQGFITCAGGNRVGFCGTAVIEPKTMEVTSVRNVSSINIRIAREIIGCAKLIYDKCFSDGISSLIVASPPCGGKTTILRDLCRLLGETKRVSVIDERGELACICDGIAQNDIGLRCDVFNGYPKAVAAMIAVRVMAPEILVCDEIGSKEDLSSLEYALNSGVKLVCSAHASTFEELKKRPAAGKLIKSHAFNYAAMLGTGSMCGRLTAFYRLEEC